MTWIYDDGLVIDEETGEIEDAPEGISDMTAFLASKVEGATQQRKEWEATERGYKRALLLRMDEPRLSFPERGLTASKRRGGKIVQKLGPIREAVLGMRLRRAELEDLLGAVARWTPTDLKTPRLQKALAPHIEKVPTAEYVIVDAIKVKAPTRSEVDPHEEAAG
jgi:hypothetical protein